MELQEYQQRLQQRRKDAVSRCYVRGRCSQGLVFTGTWGFGLIGPAGEEDEKDLEDTICRVGCGMADPILVRRLVHGIAPAISRVRAMGVKLKRADQGAEARVYSLF